MSEYEHTGRRVDVEISSETTPERAWEAWADPEKIAGWFVDRAEGRAEPGATVTWIFERFGFELPYKVLEAVPGEKIVFGPASEEVPPFLLEVNVSRHSGSTRIRLVNSGFSEDAEFDDQFSGIESGWRMALGSLGEYLERHFGKTRSTFMSLSPCTFDFATAKKYFTDPGALGEWFGTGSGIECVGDEVRMDLIDGDSVTGRVLAVTDSEAAISWSEIDGVLEFKAFAQGAEKMIGVRGWGYGMTTDRAQELEEQIGIAVRRLVELLERGG